MKSLIFASILLGRYLTLMSLKRKQIVDILSRTEFSSKFHSLKDWEDRKPVEDDKKDQEEESPEEEDHHTEEEDESSESTSDDTSESSSLPSSDTSDEEPELLKQQHELVRSKIAESLAVLEPEFFSEGTPLSAVDLLQEEHTRIIHRFDDEVFEQDETIPKHPEVVGVKNFRRNCFFNAAVKIF
jgi:hypothetical protein